MGLFDFFRSNKKPTVSVQVDTALPETMVEVEPGITVAKVFADHWEEIAITRMPHIAISATPGADLSLEQSKFGHYPYLPQGFEYPKDSEGKFLYPLAQINFAEVPALEGYPRSGFLQFYIGTDDLYGLNFDNMQEQKNFRVLFFEEADIKNYQADFSFLDPVLQMEYVPVNQPHRLEFSWKNEYVGIGDVRYEEKGSFKLSQLAKYYPGKEEEIEELGYDSFSAAGHKIGGYAYFTQEDPRLYNPVTGDYILLFQLDTDDEIMWGDSGVANFFIHPDDLAKKDFSKVMYSWDCS